MSVQKSPDAFRTISEVATELDVPQHVLRFWESKFNQIRPLKRGGGRRYYRPEDVDLLKGVRALLYNDGYTIKGVQKVFREQGVRFIADTGRGFAEGSASSYVAEPADDEERPRSAKPSSGKNLSSDGLEALSAILEELVELKEEIDETLWEDDPEDEDEEE